MKIKFSNVKWDTDGASLKSCGLKKNFTADITELDDKLADFLADWLSDTYGFCHDGFNFEIVKEN